MLYTVINIIALCLIPLIILMMVAGAKVNSTFRKFNDQPTKSGMTADQVARFILDKEGLYTVGIRQCKGKLSDHYDPKTNCLYLSEAVYGNTSVAAVGVACHEAGHAMQYADEYAPVKIRTALVPVVNFTSRLSFPLIIIAMLLEFVSYSVASMQTLSSILMLAAVICYLFYCLFTLITLPTEYNASKRARNKLEEYDIVDEGQALGVKKVLNAAANTYLISFAFSVAQLARILLIFLSGRNRR